MASYATVETALALMHGADANAQRGAFRGRLKHLQRLGLPLGEKPGKGRRIDYSEEQIWQLGFALELSEFGLDPTVIVQILNAHWVEIFHTVMSIEDDQTEKPWAVLTLSVSLMSSNWMPTGSIAKGIHTIAWITINQPIERILSANKKRVIIVDVHRIICELRSHLSVALEEY